MPKTKANQTVEDYLRSVYRVEIRDGKISNTALAREMKISGAAVTEMMQRLADLNLLRYTKYKGPSLTVQGRKLALDTTRRHRLWEVFLIRHLGYSWDQVHDLAHQLEHVGDMNLIDRLEGFLGNPTHDPHGDPIPTKEGLLPEEPWVCLDNLQVGQRGSVRRIADDTPELLRYAESMGLRLKAKVQVIGRAEFDSNLQVSIDERVQTLSQRLSQRVFVKLKGAGKSLKKSKERNSNSNETHTIPG